MEEQRRGIGFEVVAFSVIFALALSFIFVPLTGKGDVTGKVVFRESANKDIDIESLLRTGADYKVIINKLLEICNHDENISDRDRALIKQLISRGDDVSRYSEQDLDLIERTAEDIGLDIREILPSYDGNGRKSYIIKLQGNSLLEDMRCGVKRKAASSAALMKSSKAMDTKQDLLSQHRRFEYKLNDKLNSNKRLLKAGASSSDEREFKSFMKVFNGVSVRLSDEELRQVSLMQEIEDIQPDNKVKMLLYDSVEQISADEAWKAKDNSGNNITGEGVTIVIIDTGIDYTHESFGNCSSEDFAKNKCLKVIDGFDFVNMDTDPYDDHGHGTHCASTAAGDGELKGVAPDAKLVAYKVLDSTGSGYESDIIAAIERAVDPNYDFDTSDHYDIISLSLGGSGDPDDAMSRAVDNAVESGVIAVIAAGNDGPYYKSIGSPGCARKAITVGAACKSGKVTETTECGLGIAQFSSRGPAYGLDKPDITAPGVDICAAKADEYNSYGDGCYNENYVSFSGTSMATPHVAGACALALQKFPDWGPDDVKYAMQYTASDKGTDTVVQGYGEINLASLVSLERKPPIAEIVSLSNTREITE